MKQSLLASWFETIASTATGFAISLALQYVVCWWYSLPLATQDNLAIIGLFTIASLLRGFFWRRLMEKLHIRRPLSPFMQAVIAERYRQIEVEGYDLQHDCDHTPRELAGAASAYLLGYPDGAVHWPWRDGFKPSLADDRRDLVRGGALALAAGDLFDRNSKRKRAAISPLPLPQFAHGKTRSEQGGAP